MIYKILIILLLLCSPVYAAISVGNSANSGVVTSDTSATFSLDNNKTDVIVLISIRDTATAGVVTGVTYGGQDMLQGKTLVDATGILRTYLYYKLGALTGANNVVASFDSTINYICVTATAVSGLDSVSQPDATASLTFAFEESVEPNCSNLTTVAANTIVFDVWYHKNDVNFTPTGTGHTQIAQLEPFAGGDSALFGYTILSSAGAPTIGWTNSGNYDIGCGVYASFDQATTTQRRILVQ